MSTSRFRHAPFAALLVPLLAVLALGCSASTDAEPSSSSPSSAPGSGTAGELDLSGVTLRVGDQADNHLRQILEGSGEAKAAPYAIEWSTFQNGPALIAAATGGSVDVGKLSETPLIFAQAAGSPVTVVAAGRPLDPATSSLAIVVRQDSAIQDVAELKGKRVGYAPGTVLEYLLANALDRAGLSLDDIKPITLQPGVDVLGGGDADALVTGDPTMSVGLVAGTTRILVSGAELTPGFHYLTARNGALDKPELRAAIADFAERVARAEAWFGTDVEASTDLLASQAKTDPAVARAIIERAPLVYGPIDEVVIGAHQDEIDFFVAQGSLKRALDGTKIFDTSFGTRG